MARELTNTPRNLPKTTIQLHTDVPLVEFIYLVFTRMPAESYRRQLVRSLLLYLRYVFRALINSLVCGFCTRALGLVLVQSCFNYTLTENESHKADLSASTERLVDHNQ